MNIFLSKYINNIDKKGRVSIPASYRAILSSSSLIAYRSFRNNSIEACSTERFEQISKIIAKLDPYSPERDAFETVMLGEAQELTIDNEGRVIIPRPLLEYAGILQQQICLVGKGVVFEMWDPKKFEEYLVSAQEIARLNRLSLKNIEV